LFWRYPVDVHEAIRIRYSVRDYRNDPIPEESLERVLEAARLAPSGSNRQDWRFIVVKDEARKKRLAEAANNQMWIASAPVVIGAVATDPEPIMTCGHPRYAVDLAIAVDHMTLAAVQEGLGTCWIGAFSQERVRDILGADKSCMVLTILPLGYPAAGSGGAKSRKRLEEIVRYETDSR